MAINPKNKDKIDLEAKIKSLLYNIIKNVNQIYELTKQKEKSRKKLNKKDKS